MSKLIWDAAVDKKYETGVSKGILFVMDSTTGLYGDGVAWNGLVTVTESPSGAEANAKYADNIKYANMISNEEFGATIEAYTYPDEFAVCDGSAEIATGVLIGQQKRSTFAMAYETVLGNEAEGNEYGRKIHLVYGAKAAPSEKAFGSINESPELITFSWELTTTPIPVTGFRPTANIVIDTTKVDAGALAEFEELLYGKDATTDPVAAATKSKLPTPEEIIAIFGTMG